MVYVVFAIQPSARLQFREQILDPFVVPIIKAVEYMCHKNSRTDPVNFGAVFALNELCEVVKFTSDATHFIVSLRKLENNMKTGPANCNILDCIACAAEILDFAEDERFLIIIATSSPLQVTAEKCRNLIYDNFSMTDFATKFKSVSPPSDSNHII
jgi:hypothetical protein